MTPTARSMRATALACLATVAAMAGLAYASAPLYDLFCRVTGFDGRPIKALGASAPGLGARVLKVRFVANTAGLPWDFTPETDEIAVRTGAMTQVGYSLRNPTKFPGIAVASFNVQPATAAAYFAKVQCFCFTDTALGAGESRDLPVVFYLDPALETDPDLARVSTITLSYTFFSARSPARPATAEAGGTVGATPKF